MARWTDLLHELTTGKPPRDRPPMSPRLRKRLQRRWVRDVLALTFAGAGTLTIFLLGGLTFVSTLAVVAVAMTPAALIAATFALKPATHALDAAAEDTHDDT